MKQIIYETNPHTCRYWEMSETMKLAGKSQGVVRDKDTKEVLF